MPLTFDASLKDLAREAPRDFLSTFDQSTQLPVATLNVDLSAITKSVDCVIGLGEPLQEIIHFDFQANANAEKHLDILVYSALLYKFHHVPVHSIILLLRPQAAHTNMDGNINYAARPGRGKMDFDYETIPLWEIPAETLLTGDIGTVPLALLGELSPEVSLSEGMAYVVERMIQRLQKEARPERGGELLTTAFLLSGLRINTDFAEQLFQGASAMHESTTYQSLLQKGGVAMLKKTILRLGEKRFSAPPESIAVRLSAVDDVAQLERLADRILDVASWEELLADS